jgi:Tol biopolymer transport system component
MLAAAGAVAVVVHAGQAFHPGANGRIVFVRQVGGPTQSGVPLASHALYTISPDGSGERKLADVPAYGPTWSPDGSRIAFWADADPTTEFTAEENEIYVVDADGSGLQRLTSNTEVDVKPDWSPDGSQLAFVRTGRVWIMNADGTQAHAVAKKALSVAWSPDGRWIAVTRGDGTIWLVRPNGRDRHKIHESNHYGDKFGWGEPVEWTPDGRIAYIAYEAGLATMTRQATQRRRVTKLADGYQPAWSPDGRWVAVKSWTPNGLDLLAANGSSRRVLTRSRAPVHDSEPDWQPVCTLRGTAENDVLGGRPRADLACGRRGDDLIDGGAGQDRLFGGDGDDRLRAVGGGFDVVGCGAGSDTAVVDRRDLVGVDCERIVRSSFTRG